MIGLFCVEPVNALMLSVFYKYVDHFCLVSERYYVILASTIEFEVLRTDLKIEGCK